MQNNLPMLAISPFSLVPDLTLEKKFLPKRATHFLVIHQEFVFFPLAPKFGHLAGLDHPKNTFIFIFPRVSGVCDEGP